MRRRMQSINGTIMVSIVLSPYGPDPSHRISVDGACDSVPGSAHCRSEPVVVKFVPDLEA